MPAPASAKTEPHSSSGCPSDDALLSYLPGLLSDDDASVVQVHLQHCASCQSRVTTLKKRRSTEVRKSPPAAASSDEHSTQALATAAEQRDSAGPPEPPPATLAFHPKNRRFPQQLGNYQLLRQVGRGGMGVVYQAYHPRLQRHYAIKLLPGLDLGDDTAIVRLQREMAAAGRVEHEHIVYSSDAGSQDGIDYLVMEYVEGVDLARLVAECGPLPIADACEIIRQAALGLAHIESCGLVHRDIKPSNLMLSSAGVVKILDLGLARLRDRPVDDAEATHTGFLLGTADYISPEQIDTPRLADGRSDLYSLGCTLFKLLAGRAPFSDEQHSSATRKIDAHRREPPPSVRTLRPEVPEALETLLDQLLAKEPSERPQHPALVAEALQPLAEKSDLKSLLRLARARGPVDREPEPALAQTPSAIDGSTHPQGRTPTPRAIAVGLSPLWWVRATLALALAISIAAALIWFAPGIWASLTGTGPVEGPVATSPPGGEAPEVVDTIEDPLLAAAQAIALPQGDRPRTLKIEPRFQMIEASADDFQLIQLGTLQQEQGGGTIAVELEFRRDRGEAGLFFGYHEDNVIPDRLWGIGHFVHLSMLPSKTDQRLFSLIREQSQLRPGNSVLISMEEGSIKLPPTTANRYKLEVDYAPEGIQEVRLNKKAVPELLVTGFGTQFDPQTIWGVWGIYNNGSSIRVFQPTLKKGP